MEYQEVGQAEVQIVLTDIQIYAQTQVTVRARNQVYNQAQANIKAKYQAFGSPNADILKTTRVFSQSRVDILATYNKVAQTQALMNGNVFAQALADIMATQRKYAQARPRIKQTYFWYSQTKADIKATSLTYAQSGAKIIISGIVVVGQASAQIILSDIIACAQAQSQMLSFNVPLYAQTQADILATDFVYAQANSQVILINIVSGISMAQVILVCMESSQTQGTILQEYQIYTQAQAQILTMDYAYAQTCSQILLINYAVSNSMSQILTTYRADGQTQTDILAEYQTYSQTEAFVVYTYTELGQAEVQIILSDIVVYAQADAQIISFNVQVYAQATALWVERGENGEYIWPQFGYAQSLTVVNDIQSYSQAVAWIAIQRYTYTFIDTFSRTTTAPPFNVGNADTGTPWVWNAWDDDNPENVTPLYVDGSALVHGLYNGGQTYSSMHNAGATTGNQDAELTMDIWIATAGDNGAYTYWYDRNWYIRTWSDTDSTYYLGGLNNSGTIVPLNGRSAWYRLRVVVSPTDPNHVKAHFWKIGDAEPETWVVVQTAWPYDNIVGYTAPTFDIYETPYREPAKFDNIMVYTVGAFLYNQVNAAAQANINLIPRNDTPVYGQALVNIFQSGIAYYNWIIANDNPAAYYKLENLDIQPYSSAGFITDSLGGHTLTFYNGYSPHAEKIIGPMGYAAVPHQNYGYNSLSPITSGNHGWAVEWWVQPNITHYYVYNRIQNSNDYMYFGLAEPAAQSYQNRAWPPWDWYTPSVGTKALLTYVYNVGGVSYRTWIGSASLSATDWHHIVATVTDDQTRLNLYVDNSLVDTVVLSPAATGTWAGASPSHNFGSSYTNSTAYDEYVVYNHELNPHQIYNHYRIAMGSPPAVLANAQVYTIYHQETGEYIWMLQAQAQTTVLTTYQKYSQTQAFIKKGTGFGLARVRITITTTVPTSRFRYVAYADGAVAYYGMNSQSDAAVLVDDMGLYNLTTGSVAKYSWAGIISPELAAIQWVSTSYHSKAVPLPIAASEWSIEAWFKPNLNDTSMYSTVWSLLDGSNKGVVLRYGTPTVATNSSGTQFFAVEKTGTSTGTTYSSGISYKSNVWHQLIITSKDGSRNLYVDGILQSSWVSQEYSWIGFHINREPANSLYSQYEQYRDDLVIYNKELTSNQVQNHYLTMGFPKYAQAQVLINDRWAFAQATYYSFNPEPGAINIWNTHSQSSSSIKVINVNKYSQSKTSIQAYNIPQYGQAQTRIYIPSPYSSMILSDNPLGYYAMDTLTPTGTNLVRFPTSGTATYTANAGTAANAANGVYNNSWATAASAANWWKVTWSVPQTISTIVMWDRSDGGGWNLDWWGRGTGSVNTPFTITFSDGSSVTVPGMDNGWTPTIAQFSERTVSWFQINAPVGQVSNSPGFEEVLAYGSVLQQQTIYGSKGYPAVPVDGWGTIASTTGLVLSTLDKKALQFTVGTNPGTLAVATNDNLQGPYGGGGLVSGGSIEAWIQTTDATVGPHGVMIKQYDYGIFVYNGTVQAHNWAQSTWINSGITVTDGRPHHVVFTWRTGIGTLYVDGYLATTGVWNINNGAYYGLEFGNGGLWSAQGFNGIIDEAAVYGYELSSAQVWNHFVVGQGLAFGQVAVVCYPVNPDTGAMVYPRQANAKVQILEFNINGYGQAQVLIQPITAMLRINRDTGAIDTFSGPQSPYFTGFTGNWGISAAFVADKTGVWSFKLHIDYSGQLYIGATQVISTNYTTLVAGATGTISLIEGQQSSIHVDYYGDGLPNTLQVFYKRPGDTVWSYLTDEAPPWIPLPSLSRFALAGAYISPSFNQNAYGLAITQIFNTEDKYRLAVLADKPNVYYPMDEYTYGGNTYYSAINYYSGSYLPEFAADGNTNDGWAGSGYAVGDWWQVSWGNPQIIQTVRLTNRPNYTFGFGRILYSDGTSYNVTFPSASRGVSTYTAPATNVTWMRLISDGGGNTHPGFSEVEAFNGDATNLVRFPVITGPVPLPELSTIIGRRNATWDSAGAIFSQTPAILSGTSISFNGTRALAAGKSQRLAGVSTVPLTIPGYQGQENNMNVISPLWWGEAGDIITIHITTPPTSNDIGIYQIGGENQWWSAGGYQTTNGLVGTAGTDVSFTLTTTGPHCVYIWSYNAAYTGAGTLTLNNGGIIDSVIPTAIGAAITVETWIKWDGTGDYRMILGFDRYDFHIRDGHIGFNAANGTWETGVILTAGVWYHVAGIMYNRQAFSIANKIYVNGVLQSLSGTDQTGWFQPYFSISGWSANTSYRLGGTLDEYAIFDHALTAEQILAHYKSRIILWNANTQARIIGFNYQLYSQALAMMKGLEFAQAQARIVGEYPRYGQALSLITRIGEGLVRMIWTGEYTPYPDNIIAWGIEDGPNQIYYDNGTAPLPGYPGSNAGASWSARFIADATGTWAFRTVSDDNSEVTIDSVVIVANYSDQFTTVGTGHGDWDRSGTVALTLGQEYNLHVRWTQGGGPYTIHVYYKRPTDVDWVLLTNNRPPWLFITKIFAQAQAVILPPPNKREFGQAQATIIGRVYSQAQTQADILRVYARTSQAQVWIGHFQFALVTASILQTVRRFAQTTAWILPPTVTSQAQVWILATTRSYSQVLTFVGHFQFGKAQAKLNAFDVNRFAQTTGLILKSAGYGKARVCIKRIEYKYGQAQTWYLPASPPALAVGAIKQTYPLMSMDINYALVGYGAHASDVLEDPVAPYYAIDGNDIGPIWTIVGIHTVENPLWLEIDLGTTRTINMYRILPSTYDCFVSLQYHNGSIWITVLDAQFNVGIFEGLNPAKAISGMIGPISARRWRLLVTDDGDYNGIAIATFELGFATAKSPTFAQAQAFFGHFGLGQARVYSWPAYDVNVYGQAKVSMVNTYEKFSQTEAWIIPPTVIGLSLASILQEYNQYSIVNAWIIPPTVFGFAQAQIIAFNVSRFAQTLVVTKQTYNRVAQAKVKITKFAGHAQAIVTIMDRYHGKYVGHARVYVGHFQFGQSLAYVIKYWQFAQVRVSIIQVRLRGMGQAAVYIRPYPNGLAMANIKQQYETYGLVGTLLNTGFGLAATKGTIKQVYLKGAQTQADIEQTYPRLAQAQVIITIRYRALAQARALLVTQRTSVAQAMVYVGYHKFSQAQTRIIAYAVPKFGVAAGYILAGQTVLGPSSEYHTYLVRYNGHDLPGYCQSESYGDALTTVSHYASYVDASLTEDMGLQNISITLEMLLWEPTYQACKDKLQLAATIMRIQKGFSPLYIQRFDRYYLAIAKSITASKAVPESPRILKYTLEFEAKPWTINN